MKYLVLLLALLYIPLIPAQAADLTLTADCQQSLEHGVQVFVGYSASDDFEAVSEIEFTGSASLIGDIPSEFEAGDHTRVFSILLMEGAAAYWSVQSADTANALTVWDGMDLPDCQSEPASPPTIDIPIELTSDCAFVETKDYLNGTSTGHWSQVTSDGVPVLLHYGQDLIGSAAQSADPTDYRAIATPCY